MHLKAMLNEPKIIWEKWTDPYNINSDNDLDWSDDEDKNFYDTIKQEKNNVLLTNMGIIPYNEHTDCCKIFNFWIGHTNFNLSNRVIEILQKIDGIETLDIFTRYRFRVSFGKAFIDREIMNNINNQISLLLNN
jgi:hypothetical protein